MSLASWDLVEFGGGITLLGKRSREPGPQGSPVGVAPPLVGRWWGVGESTKGHQGACPACLPRQGPGINTPWAEIKPISKLCSLRPREVQGLGLEGGQPGSDQQPHSGCPWLLLPPSGLSPTRSRGSGPGRGRAPCRLGAIPGLMGPCFPLGQASRGDQRPQTGSGRSAWCTAKSSWRCSKKPS